MDNLFIALVGDYNPAHIAHQAIPRALELAATSLGCTVDPTWLHTGSFGEHTAFQLEGFDGVWCVPGSPYANMDGVLRAIRFAREENRPFLATCGGFQHAIIEFARNVLHLEEADHAESAPQATTQIITPLSCALVEENGEILLTEGTRLRTAYGASRITERYHCSYGMNRSFVQLLRAGGLAVAGVDNDGEVRAVEIPSHPFFIGTLFQPERSSLAGAVHPVIAAFLAASRKRDA